MSDKYYVSGVIEIEGTCGRVADEDAEFWTVYEVQADGRSLAICDCYSREKADEIACRMMAMEGISNLNLKGGWSAKGLSDYAKSLEEQLAQRDAKLAALTAENVVQNLAFELAREEMKHYHDDAGMFSYDADGEPMDALLRLCDAEEAINEVMKIIKTPLTDAAVNELRAEGVEWFRKWLRDSADTFDQNGKHEWADKNRVAADKAKEFANQLREGK